MTADQPSDLMNIRIVCPDSKGHEDFKLTQKAFKELSMATHAGLAEYAFNRFARHVPPFYRLAVWNRVDEILAQQEDLQ